MKLACALHRYGTPSHRLENAMTLVSKKIGLDGQFFLTPTGLFASFGSPEEQKTVLIRVEPGSVDLQKMALLDELAEEVIAGRVDLSDGAEKVEAIMAAPSRYGPLLTALCFGVSSATAARFIGGGWREIVIAGYIGVCIGLLSLLGGRFPSVSRVFDPTAALLASALGIVGAHFFWPISLYRATLAGMIVLLPGLTVTTAMNELAMRNLVAGTARLTGAIVTFLEIGIGVALGGQVARFLPPPSMFGKSVPLPAWTEWAALFIAPFSLSVLFRARVKDMIWAVLATFCGYFGARAGAQVLGPELGGCLGGLAVGIGGNLFARFLNKPSAIFLVPGIMILVPGSVGYGSLSKFLENDVVSGVEAAFRMILIAVSLVSGLLMANVLLPPRKAL